MSDKFDIDKARDKYFPQKDKDNYTVVNAITDALTGKTVWASNELKSHRLEVCGNCEHHYGVVCGKCGCILEAKASRAKSSCPINKW